MTTHLRESLSSVGWDFLRSTCPPNLKSMSTKMIRAMQNVELMMVWVV